MAQLQRHIPAEGCTTILPLIKNILPRTPASLGLTHFKSLHKVGKWLGSTLRLAPTPAPAGGNDEIDKLNSDDGMDDELGAEHNEDKNGFDDVELGKDKNDKIISEAKNNDDMLDTVLNGGKQEKEPVVIVINDDNEDDEDEEEDK
jgi:hypothetical protein